MAAIRRAVVLVIVLATALSGGVATAQNKPVRHIACGLSQRIDQRVRGGVRVISRPNPFNTSGQRLCIAGSRRPGFRIVDNLRFTGKWQAYPFTGVGCAYDLCTRHTNLPMQVRSVPRAANTSFAWHGPSRGNWNASYDIWFDHHDQITRQDNGAELMIWLRPNPGYHGGVQVNVGKHRYWFVHWVACNESRTPIMGPPPPATPGHHTGPCWNYVQFRFLRVMHGVRRLWLRPFIRFLEQQRLMRPSWWLTSIHAGYELVQGGKGLTTTWFNVHI